MSRPWSLRTQLVLVVVGGVLGAYVLTGWLLIPAAKEALRNRIDAELVRDLPTVAAAVGDGRDLATWQDGYEVVLRGDGNGPGTGQWSTLPVTGPRAVAPAAVDGTLYRYLAVDLGRPGILVVAATTAALDDLVDTLVGSFLAVGGATTAAVAVLTWWWLHRGLRPLERLAAAAAAVTAGDSRPALAVPARSREISVLVAALDDMLRSLREAVREREAGEDRMRTFVADAGHELRSPLTTVSGYLDLDLRGGLPDRAGHDDAIARALSEARRMRRMVGDLQLLAESDADQPLGLGPVDVTAVARDTVTDAALADPDRRYVLDEQQPGSDHPPATAAADPDSVRQILTNILSNVRVHTPPGTTARVAVTGAHASWVTIRVSDDGPGVPSNHLPHLTQRFWRLDPSRSRTTGGNGLGLAVVAGLVSRHGGTAEFTAVNPTGLEVTVRLPMVDADHTRSADT